MSREQTLDALILDAIPYRDYDLIVRLFLPRQGPVSAMAYAARKSRVRFPSGVDRLTLAEISMTRKGDRMPVLKSVITKEVFWGIKSDLDKTSAASLVSELMMKAHVEELEATEVYEFACRFMKALEQLPPSSAALAALYGVARLLFLLKFLPGTLACTRCNRTDSSNWLFHTGSGELVCAEHDSSRAGTIPLSQGEVGLLNSALTAGGDLKAFVAAENARAGRALETLTRLEPFLGSIFGSPPKSLEFLKQIMPR